jgi:hypothetical protein
MMRDLQDCKSVQQKNRLYEFSLDMDAVVSCCGGGPMRKEACKTGSVHYQSDVGSAVVLSVRPL